MLCGGLGRCGGRGRGGGAKGKTKGRVVIVVFGAAGKSRAITESNYTLALAPMTKN